MLRGVNSAINSLFKNGDIAAALHTLQQQLPVFDGKQNTIYPHSGKQTQFTAFSSNSVIVNGVLTNTLALTGQQFHMQGGGTLDFTRKNYIDYTLSAALLQDNAGNAGNAIHMQVPFKITGTPQALNYGVDMGPIETQLTEIFVKKVQNAAKQQLENAAGAAGSLLQNLIAK